MSCYPMRGQGMFILFIYLFIVDKDGACWAQTLPMFRVSLRTVSCFLFEVLPKQFNLLSN